MLNAQKEPHETFYKKAVLTSFAVICLLESTCYSLFLNKVVDLGPKACNFIKKETLTQVFSYQYCKIFENNYFEEHLETGASEYSQKCILGINGKNQ